MTHISELSPRTKARLAGTLYVIIIITATFAELIVRSKLVIYQDAAATAANILAHQSLYRFGGVAILIAVSCDVVVALLLYQLLKPVSRSLSFLAASFRLVQVAILAVNLLNHFAPLVLLGGVPSVSASAMDQLQAQALISLRLYAQGFNIAMVFFGFGLVFLGYLVFRSTFLPRVLGVLVSIAGFCYLANSFASFLAPALAAQLYPAILVPCFIGELFLTIWLLVVGVNVKRWEELDGE